MSDDSGGEVVNSAATLDSTFVAVPALRVAELERTVEVTNLAAGTAREFSHGFLEMLDHFRRPRTLRSWLERPGASARDIPAAIGHAFLIAVDLLAAPAPDAIGDAVTLSQLLAGSRDHRTVIFGAPVDGASTGRGGARAGPAEIRKLARPHFTSAAASVHLDFEMRRQYAGLPAVADLGAVAGLAGESMATYGPRIALICDLILERGAVPGMLGGDHSCTAFALEAQLGRWPALGIIHFDAHHDLWPPAGPHFHYVTHANVFHELLGAPALRVMRQLGLRVFEAAPGRQLRDDPRISFRSARELQRMSPEAAFAGLPRDIPYYLTFDIDCLDPVFAPETGTPLAGGLSYHQALDLVDYAAREFRLVGWDIVEVGQAQGPVNGAAMCAAGLLRRLLIVDAPFEPLGGYVQAVAPAPAEAAAPASPLLVAQD